MLFVVQDGINVLKLNKRGHKETLNAFEELVSSVLKKTSTFFISVTLTFLLWQDKSKKWKGKANVIKDLILKQFLFVCFVYMGG